MCHLLLGSAKLVDLDSQASAPSVLNQTDDPPRSLTSKNAAASITSHDLVLTAGPSSPNYRERLNVNVLQIKSSTGQPRLGLGLSRNGVREAKPFLIQEIHTRKPPFILCDCC